MVKDFFSCFQWDRFRTKMYSGLVYERIGTKFNYVSIRTIVHLIIFPRKMTKSNFLIWPVT